MGERGPRRVGRWGEGMTGPPGYLLWDVDTLLSVRREGPPGIPGYRLGAERHAVT
jgi:hypothetical protein